MADYTNGVKLTGYADVSVDDRSEYLGAPPITITTTLTELLTHFPTSANIGLDSPVQRGIGFYYPNYTNPVHSVTFPLGQWYPRESEADRPQVILESASGKVSIYDAGFAGGMINVTIRQMTEAKRVRLYCFLVNICKKAMYSFDFYERGASEAYPDVPIVYRVRWVNSFHATMPYWAKNEIALTFRKEQE